jgi:hypothetical protein
MEENKEKGGQINAPLIMDCYNCGENGWELTLFGHHLQCEYLFSEERTEAISEEEVHQISARIRHPEIDHTLADLGMIINLKSGLANTVG